MDTMAAWLVPLSPWLSAVDVSPDPLVATGAADLEWVVSPSPRQRLHSQRENPTIAWGGSVDASDNESEQKVRYNIEKECYEGKAVPLCRGSCFDLSSNAETSLWRSLANIARRSAQRKVKAVTLRL